jgi:hypothetical protein
MPDIETANALRNYEYLSEDTRDSIPKGFTLFGPPAELMMQERVSSIGGLLPFFKELQSSTLTSKSVTGSNTLAFRKRHLEETTIFQLSNSG